MYMYLLQLVIEEVSSRRATVVVVKARYLVPDTNCFIDMLANLQKLVKFGSFVIAVPLTGELICLHAQYKTELCALSILGLC